MKRVGLQINRTALYQTDWDKRRRLPGAATCDGVVGTLRPPDSSSWVARNEGLSYIPRPEDKSKKKVFTFLWRSKNIIFLLLLAGGVFNAVLRRLHNMWRQSTSLWRELSQVRVWGGTGLWHVVWETKPEARHTGHLGRTDKQKTVIQWHKTAEWRQSQVGPFPPLFTV